METAHCVTDNMTTTTTPPPVPLPQPQAERPLSSTVVRPIANKIQPQLWKPWLYSASLYQDWISRLTQQHLNFVPNSIQTGLVTDSTENKNAILENTVGFTFEKNEQFQNFN